MSTVVIADDSPTLRRIVSTVLSREGYDVVEAVDGVDAVQAVFRTQPDAVVLDVQMPRLSGYVAARVLTDDWQTAHIPVIMLTSLDSATDRYWGASTGAQRYLTKDFEPPQLAGAVRDAIEAAGLDPALRPDPVELDDDDVMARVADLLDRKLFETSVAAEVTAIPATARGLEETVAALLSVLGRVVEYDLAAVLLVRERTAYVGVGANTAHLQYDAFLRSTVDAAATATDSECVLGELDIRLADAQGRLGADVYGLSSQDTEYQAELAERLGLPFPVLSDPGLELAGLLGLPTFTAGGERLYKRLTMIVSGGAVEHVFYPVFPPDGHAAEVAAWLSQAG